MNESTAYALQKIFKMLYFEGYSISEVTDDAQACAIIEQMTKCKKINYFQMGVLKSYLENKRKAKL